MNRKDEDGAQRERSAGDRDRGSKQKETQEQTEKGSKKSFHLW